MKFIGKLLGAILGYIVGGPYGLVMGLLLGQLIDSGYFHHWFHQNQYRRAAEEAFFTATFLCLGHLAKADGHVTSDEIAYAKRIMQQLQLSPEAEQRAIALFRQGKDPQFDINATLRHLHQLCHQDRPLLNLFIEWQIAAALSDHRLRTEEKALLFTMCKLLGFSPLEFTHLHSQIYDESQQQTPSTPPSLTPLEQAYQTLQINADAKDEEIKRAYRRMISQHHPDKLIARGLPASMIKVATQKTQAIQAAYDLICEKRRANTHRH